VVATLFYTFLHFFTLFSVNLIELSLVVFATGHGDGEDQLRPKLVEALRDHCVTDVACGSGDAQTLCITSDNQVWSWGDGDYGKLGRGGSDGCKVPLVIDELSGKSVIKVECGSQFSMALTRYGALYTWYVVLFLIFIQSKQSTIMD